MVVHTIDGPDTPALVAATALGERGHDVVVISSQPLTSREAFERGVRVVRVARLPEAPLRYRGFTGPLTQAPLLLRALERGRFDVVHTFSPEDAWIVLRRRGRGGRPVVFTAAEPLARDHLADKRLRMRAVRAAVEDSDAVTAPSEELAAVVARWLAVDATVLDPRDGVAHERLYRQLLRQASAVPA
jgi:hypothetical protein